MKQILTSKRMSLRSTYVMLGGSMTTLIESSLRSYVEFMMISKEISTLENDMLELKASLSEWKSMPSLLHIDDTATVAGTISALPSI